MKISPQRLALTQELHALVDPLDRHDVDTNWGAQCARRPRSLWACSRGRPTSYPWAGKVRAFYKWREDRGARTVVHAVHNFQALSRKASTRRLATGF